MMTSLSENILSLICGLGILQGILLAIIIFFHPRSDRNVNTFLALHIFFISLAITMPFIIRFITWQRGNLMQLVLLLPAVFLYLYVRSFKERLSVQKLWPHFLLFLLFAIVVFWNTTLIAAKYPGIKTPPEEVFQDPFNIIIPVIQIGLKIFYYFLALKTLLSYQKSILQMFSETSRIDLIWAKTLTNSYLFLVLAGTVIFILMIRYPKQFNLLLMINVILGTPYIYFATYKGITQPSIWDLTAKTGLKSIKEEANEHDALSPGSLLHEKSRVTKLSLSNDKIGEIAGRVNEAMVRDKIFLEPELTLQQLADNLSYPSHQVSYAINDGLKKSFYDLINGYRVEEAKRLLLDSKNVNYTILSVGFEAGFNSKTTFNTVFKKFTGFTPSEFRQQQRNKSMTA